MRGAERGFQLGEGAAQVLAERRKGEALRKRSAEVQSRQLRESERRVVELPEGAGIEFPPLGDVVRHVVDRETGFLERLQIAPNGARRHSGRLGEPADGGPARGLELAENGPLAYDFGVARQPFPPGRRINDKGPETS